jgi:glycosyltransferase involved in cell wall biosynthesis
LPYLFPKAGRLRAWITRRLLADADAVVMTNQADWAQVTGRRSRRGWGIESAALIPIGSNIAVAPPAGYDRAAWRARLQVEPGETLIAYFGLISRTKGLDVLLDALARLPAHVRLLVVGGGANAPEDRAYAESIHRRLAQLGLEQRVTITGHCAEPEVSAHLLAADLAALPFIDGASFRRGSLLAALAHGLPTVTTFPTADDAETRRQGDNGQFPIPNSQFPIPNSQFSGLVDGENVLLTPPGDPEALAGAIERLAGDAALRARLAAGGRALAAQFGWPEIAARHEQLYEGLAQH